MQVGAEHPRKGTDVFVLCEHVSFGSGWVIKGSFSSLLTRLVTETAGSHFTARLFHPVIVTPSPLLGKTLEPFAT